MANSCQSSRLAVGASTEDSLRVYHNIKPDTKKRGLPIQDSAIGGVDGADDVNRFKHTFRLSRETITRIGHLGKRELAASVSLRHEAGGQ
jgi:hypothetical protein